MVRNDTYMTILNRGYQLIMCVFMNQTIGFLVGSIIVALRVTQGSSTPSEFVIFVIYLGQVRREMNPDYYVLKSSHCHNLIVIRSA